MLYLTGVVGWFWPFVVVALYAAGALLAPAEKVRLVPDTSAELRASLEALVRRVSSQASRMPASTVDTVAPDRRGPAGPAVAARAALG